MSETSTTPVPDDGVSPLGAQPGKSRTAVYVYGFLYLVWTSALLVMAIQSVARAR